MPLLSSNKDENGTNISVCPPLVLFWDNFGSKIRVPRSLYRYGNRIRVIFGGCEIGFGRAVSDEYPIKNIDITQ